jgi:cytidylate kinase
VTPLIVAIDGPSASGKTTIGRRLARALGLPLVDSGLMYRAVTVLAADAGIDPSDTDALAGLSESADIEVNPSTDEGQHWEVKAGGVDLTQRVFDPSLTPTLTRVSQVAGVRDALVRRQRGLQKKDEDAAMLKGEIDDRDIADSTRSLAPLRPAPDALTIETDGRSAESVYEEILRLIPSHRRRGSAAKP